MRGTRGLVDLGFVPTEAKRRTHKSRNHTPWYLFSKCLTPFLLGTFFDFHDISAGHQDLAEQKTP